jgi:hypothetical protein
MAYRDPRCYRGRRARVLSPRRLSRRDADRTAAVSLSIVPRDAKDGELFFVLSSGGTWSVEYAPELQLDKLQRHG